MVTTKFRRMLASAVGLVAVSALAVPIPGAAQRAVGGARGVGGELPVSQPVEGGPRSAHGADDRAVTFGGAVFLVAWVDLDGQLWAARVDPSGTVLDPYGLRLSARSAEHPSISFDGTNFLVVWETAGAILGRRVSPAGLVDAQPFTLASGNVARAEASFGGGNHLVVWTTTVANRTDIHGTRVSPAGAVLDDTTTPIVAAPGNEEELDLAFNGTDFYLVWDLGVAGASEIYGTLVTTGGVASTPTQLPTPEVSNQIRPVVTSVGTSFFVAWVLAQSGANDVHGTRVDASGAVLDDPAIEIASTPRATGPGPEVASDGTNAVVTWSDPDVWDDARTVKLHAARVDPTGTILDPSGPELTPGSSAQLAFGGGNFLVTHLNPDHRTFELTRMTPALAPLGAPGVDLGTRANTQTDVDLAFDGANHFAVWSDARTGRSEVYGARVGSDGRTPDGPGVLLSVPSGTEDSVDPSVAFDGTNYLVVWREQAYPSAVKAARVSRTGAVLNRFDVAVPDDLVKDVSVAFGNGQFLVAWTLTRGIAGTRVSTAGAVLDPGGIPITSQYTTAIDIAGGGAEFLVVWQQHGSSSDVSGAVVTPAGTVGAADIPVTTAQYEQVAPRVAWQNGTYLVVWQHIAAEIPRPNSPSDIHGARVDGAGTVLDPTGIRISTAPSRQEAPSVAGNGPFLVTWTDRRRGPAGTDNQADVYATRVEQDGTVRTELIVSSTDEIEGWSAAAPSAGNGHFAVSYGRFVPEAPNATTRAFVRRISPK